MKPEKVNAHTALLLSSWFRSEEFPPLTSPPSGGKGFKLRRQPSGQAELLLARGLGPRASWWSRWSWQVSGGLGPASGGHLPVLDLLRATRIHRELTGFVSSWETAAIIRQSVDFRPVKNLCTQGLCIVGSWSCWEGMYRLLWMVEWDHWVAL